MRSLLLILLLVPMFISCRDNGINNQSIKHYKSNQLKSKSDRHEEDTAQLQENILYSDFITITGNVDIYDNMKNLVGIRYKKSYNLPETEKFEQNKDGLYKFVILSKDKKVLYTFNQDYSPMDINCANDIRCIKFRSLYARFKLLDDGFYLKLFYADKLRYESKLIKIIKCKADTSMKCSQNIRYGRGS